MGNQLTIEDVLISAVIYAFIAFMLIGVSVMFFIYYSRKMRIQKMRVQRGIENKGLELNYQKKMLQTIILTQEEERKRIAQDLHDDVSSKLNIISLNSHLLASANLSDIEINEITSNIITISSKVLESSRRIAHDLLPPILNKFGLHAAIEELCLSYNSCKKIKINYGNHYSQLIFDEINFEKHLHIFRILQELITNSLRHGEATVITIHIKKENNLRICNYLDNGKGFSKNENKNTYGIGMRNIESRVEFLKGEFKITSTPNRGVKATLSF